MRIPYTNIVFTPPSRLIIAHANDICEEYAAQGYDLTLRQLYYQFVSRDLIRNKQSEYDRLGRIVNDARMAGLIDWEYIVDRTRNLRRNPHWDNPQSILAASAESFQLDKWEPQYQSTRIEVWIEKDALVGVLESCCPDEDVDFFSCRGYTSVSEMWRAAQRLRGYLEEDQDVVILHLGDHDPSGIDMSRDIEERLRTFILRDWLKHMQDNGDLPERVPENEDSWKALALEELNRLNRRFNVERIALNRDQIDQYDPPPNPTKLSDARAPKYIEEHGNSSWELDALEPTTLVNLIRDNVRAYRDEDRWTEAIDLENEHKTLLAEASDRWDEVVDLLS